MYSSSHHKDERSGCQDAQSTVTISVIMLTYNRELLVARAIQSILAQTFDDFELILINNGSTDKSGDICLHYAQKDRRVRYFETERGNIGSGRNRGLEKSRGKYIAFIDDDDWAEPDMLDFLYKLAHRSDADISFCGSWREVDGAVSPNCVFTDHIDFTPEQAIYELLERKYLNAATPTKLFRRELFSNLCFPEEGKYDDISTVYKLFASARAVVAHGLPKYCFCRHAGNNSSFTDADEKLTSYQLEEYFHAYRERTEWLSKKLPEIADYVRYSEWSYYLSMLNKLETVAPEGCEAQLQYLRKELVENYDEFLESVHLKAFEKEWLLNKQVFGRLAQRCSID